MENPLERPVPDDPIERIHDFACDLAYGASVGDWESTIIVGEDGEWMNDPRGGSLTLNGSLLERKWPRYTEPSRTLLISFDYLRKEGERGTKGSSIPFEQDYILTPKAFSRLETNQPPPSVFISYKQSESSALALLIESRLKLKDQGINVFIDRDLASGQQWEDEIRRKVETCQYFVCLLTFDTLTSQAVRNEIELAINFDRVVIPFCHNHYKLEAKAPESLQDKRVISQDLIKRISTRQAVIIEKESAEEYDLKVVKLLRSMGYSAAR